MDKKFFVFIFTLLISFTFSVSFNTDFISNFSADYKATINLNITPNFTAVANGIELKNNDYICLGLPITITASNISKYIPLSMVVECAFTCQTYSLPQSVFPQNVNWLSQSEFNGNRTPFLDYPSECIAYRTAQPINPLYPYNFTSNYRTLTKSTTGTAMLGLLCYGNITAWDGNNQIPFTYTPSTSGKRELKIDLTTNKCAAITRSFETNGATFDCWYHNDNLDNKEFISSINLTYTNGPNLTLTPTQSNYVVTPNGQVTFKFTMNNSGDVSAIVNSVSISDGFVVNSFTPSTINAGEVVDFTVTATAPNVAPGTTVTPTVNFTFSSATPIIGTCGTGSGTNVIVGSVVIGEIHPISVKIYAFPSSIFNEGSLFLPGKVNITAKIWRDDPSNYGISDVITNISIYYYNTTLRKWRLKFNITDISGASGTFIENGRTAGLSTKSDGIYINMNETISSSSPFNYVPGIYRVNITSYDEYATTGSKTQNDYTYFVVFNLPGCARKV